MGQMEELRPSLARSCPQEHPEKPLFASLAESGFWQRTLPLGSPSLRFKSSLSHPCLQSHTLLHSVIFHVSMVC